jgi:hypothetical protein
LKYQFSKEKIGIFATKCFSGSFLCWQPHFVENSPNKCLQVRDKTLQTKRDYKPNPPYLSGDENQSF